MDLFLDFFAACCCSCLRRIASFIWSSLFCCCSFKFSAAACLFASILSLKPSAAFVKVFEGFDRVPFDLTVTPLLLEDGVTDLDEVFFLAFKDFRIANLSSGVILSEGLLWDKPANFILSKRASSLIFKVFAKSLTVNVILFLFYLNQLSLAFIIIFAASLSEI